MDTLGLLLCVVIHSAGIQDREGAYQVIAKLAARCMLLRHIWADGGYAGSLVTWTAAFLGWTLQIVKRTDKGFKLLPRRWVVERTFAWIVSYRRNAKDYEYTTKSAEAFVFLAMTRIMLKRLNCP